MASGQFLPFETVDPLGSTAVKLDSWSLDEWEIPTDLSESDWVFDPEVSTKLYRQYVIEPEDVAVEVRQGPAAIFDLVVKVRSRHTGLRAHFDIATFGATDPVQEDAIYLEIPNESIGGRLELCTRLVLRNPDPRYTFAATRKGSIIFEDIIVQNMEGIADVFPHLEASDLNGFLGMLPGPHWLIDGHFGDLTMDKTQAITVSINSSSRTGEAIIERRAEAADTRRAMLADLYRHIIEAALSSEEYKLEVEAKGRMAFHDHPRSVGRLMCTTMALCGIPLDPSDARALRDGRPYEFEARIHNQAFKALRP